MGLWKFLGSEPCWVGIERMKVKSSGQAELGRGTLELS